jgi:two-component system, chemotaxis family, sensor kinase CheA
MIEDPELRSLFQTECDEHLQRLEEGLLRLESAPQDTSALDTSFRATHSLKGTGRMLEIEPLESIAHRCEDLLGQVRRGQLAFTPELLDKLSPALDAMRKIVEEVMAGGAITVSVAPIIGILEGTVTPVAPVAATPPPPVVEVVSVTEPEPVVLAGPVIVPEVVVAPEVIIAPEVVAVAQTEIAPAPVPTQTNANANNANAEWETVRVAAQKLDALILLAGELSVTTQRLGRSLRPLEELVALWEEANHAPNMREGLKTRIGQVIGELQRATAEDSSRLNLVADELEESIRGLRLLPLSQVFSLFGRTVRDLSRAQGKEVRLEIEGGDTTADKRILEEIKDPLTHMIRNSIDHGIETPDERVAAGKQSQATITLRAYQSATRVIVEIEDDGRGLNAEAISRTALKRGVRTQEQLDALSVQERQRLVFEPGFSTKDVVSDVSGRGVGMDVVLTNVEKLRGTISIDSRDGLGCKFQMQFPITLVTTRVLLLQESGNSYALPMESVDEARLVPRESLFLLEGRLTLSVRGEAIPVAPLHEVLGLPGTPHTARVLSCVLIQEGTRRAGILVEALEDEQELLLKPLAGQLRNLPLVTGATVLGTGEICLALAASELLTRVHEQQAGSWATVQAAVAPKKTVLLVEDSVTTRTWEKRALEGAGYIVVTAVDGEDGYEKLLSQPFDGIVSDIEMPRLDGLALTERVRKDSRFATLPIILVTTHGTEEDRQRGMSAGANAYLVKGPLEKAVLLQTLERWF